MLTWVSIATDVQKPIKTELLSQGLDRRCMKFPHANGMVRERRKDNDFSRHECHYSFVPALKYSNRNYE
jgi:hypothetical protein